MMTTPALLKPFTMNFFWISLRGVVVVTPWLVHLMATDVLISLLLPISFFAPTLAYNVSSRLAYLVWHGIQLIFTKFNGAHITTSGARLPQNESAIVIANHISWADFYLIQQLALQSNMLGRCRWFAKQQLRWVPFLGWGLWAMGMPLVSRKWDKDQRELERVFRGPKLYKWPIWLVSYSESTRFTPQKYLETVQWCKANDKEIPKFTLYPRTKGFVTTVKQLGDTSSVKAVYDLTLAYAHRGWFLEAPEMWQTLCEPQLNENWRFHVHAERFEMSSLTGKSEAELAAWLENRWMVKSKRLTELQTDLEDGKEWSEKSLAEERKDK